MTAKRKGARPWALTDEQAEEIRAAYKKPCPHCGHKTTLQMLADQYGVSRVAIHLIVVRRNHKV